MSRDGSGVTNTILVSQCLKGDERAWHELVGRYKNLVYSIPLKYGIPRHEAADIFQSVWLDLFNELPRLREPEALQGWLASVASHKCHQWNRQQPTGDSVWNENGVEEQAVEDGLPPDLLAELERERLVREAIAELPPRCREMIEMLFFEHPPVRYAEVARRLRLAPGSIGFIRGRCLSRLKRILQERGF